MFATVIALVIVVVLIVIAILYAQNKTKLKHHLSAVDRRRFINFRLAWPQFVFQEHITSAIGAAMGDKFGCLTVSPEARFLAISAQNGGENGYVNVISLGTQKVETIPAPPTCTKHDNFGTQLQFLNDHVLVVLSKTGWFQYTLEQIGWVETDQQIFPRGEYHMQVRPDGKIIAAGQTDQKKHSFVYEHNGNHKHKSNHHVVSLCLCGETGDIVIGYDNNTLRVLDSDFNVQQTLTTPGTPTSLTASASGCSFVCGCPNFEDYRGCIVSYTKKNQQQFSPIGHYRTDRLTQPGDRFGLVQLSADGLLMTVSAPGQKQHDTGGYGAVFIFRRQTEQEDFSLVQKIIPSSECGQWGQYGTHVAFDADNTTMWLSATGSHLQTTQGGAVYKYFVRSLAPVKSEL